ncbi:MAG: Fe-S oxidoreductase [Candidatus Rokuibacteriota bacterium]|nr:MAG: Fe-S oxidoreductase [Candidatus Rokubacteria bacterium]
MAIVRLLRRLGVSVDFPAGQTCCGLPLLNSGYRRDAARVARRTVPLFKHSGDVIVPSGSCAWMIKKEYPSLLKDDPAAFREAQSLAARTYELSQFLVRKLGVTTLASTLRGRVAYHDSCHLLRGLGESEAPRTLLRNLPGVELVELPGADQCCGFGGSFSIRLPEVSSAILDRKLASVEATGADCLVACDAGCLMQMSGGLTRRGSRVSALHLAELLDHRRGPRWPPPSLPQRLVAPAEPALEAGCADKLLENGRTG